MPNDRPLLIRLKQTVESSLPASNDTSTPMWQVLLLPNPKAPVVVISRDPRAGACATPVFFVSGSSQELKTLLETLFARTGGLAPFAHFTMAADEKQFLVVPAMYHMHEIGAFVDAVTAVLQDAEQEGELAWMWEPCEVLISHEGRSYKAVRDTLGEVQVDVSGGRLNDYRGSELLAILEKPEIYHGLDDKALHAFVFSALAAHGGNAGGTPAFLVTLCQEWAKRLLLDKRLALEAALRDEILEGRTGGQALLPLMLADPDPTVVSTATIDFCALSPSDTDGLDGVREAIQLFKSGRASNRAAIFLGLLSLGDRRIMPAITKLRAALVRVEFKEVCASEQVMLHAPLVEFLVDWLAEAPSTDDPTSPFGAIAGFLFRLARDHTESGVVELERVFPVRLEHPGAIKRGQWTVQEFGLRIAPQLAAIARRESEPKVIAKVMEAWGIEC